MFRSSPFSSLLFLVGCAAALVGCAADPLTAVSGDNLVRVPDDYTAGPANIGPSPCSGIETASEILSTYEETEYGVGLIFGSGDENEGECVCTEFVADYYRDHFDIDMTGSSFGHLGRASNWPDRVGEHQEFMHIDCDDAVPGDIVYYDNQYDPAEHDDRDMTLQDAQSTAPNTPGKHVAMVVSVNSDGVESIADSSAPFGHGRSWHWEGGVNVWTMDESYSGTASRNGAQYRDGNDIVNWTAYGSDGRTRYRRYICLRHRERVVDPRTTELSREDGSCETLWPEECSQYATCDEFIPCLQQQGREWLPLLEDRALPCSITSMVNGGPEGGGGAPDGNPPPRDPGPEGPPSQYATYGYRLPPSESDSGTVWIIIACSVDGDGDPYECVVVGVE